MNQIKLSIIIPAFNVKDYIERCLDSVIPQLQEGVEVIVIDDSSTDGTSEILKPYFYYESCHFFRTMKNMGVSFARNAGIDNSRGKYITFLDADDCYGKNAVETMMQAMEFDRDIVQFNQWRHYEESGITTLRYTNRAGDYSLYDRPRMWCMVWNKIYLRKFLHDNHISFKQGFQFGEDELFNLKCMLADARFYHTKQATVIKHFENKTSICHGLNPQMLHKQDDVLTSLYWGMIYRGEDEKKIKEVENIIREHRSSKLYLETGLRKEEK